MSDDLRPVPTLDPLATGDSPATTEDLFRFFIQLHRSRTTYYKLFAHIGGSTEAGLILSVLWNITFGARGSGAAGADGWWLVMSRENWMDATGLGDAGQDRGRRELRERKLIEEERKGMHGRLRVRLSVTEIIRRVGTLVPPVGEEPLTFEQKKGDM